MNENVETGLFDTVKNYFEDNGYNLSKELESKPIQNEVSNEYVVDLQRWNISNKGINPKETSQNINNMLEWAWINEYGKVKFPNGIYLIDETNPINLKSRTKYDLGGAIFRINPNNLEEYSILNIIDAYYTSVTNGIIIGDRDEHDYSSGGTHEWGSGIKLVGNCRFISIENLEISHCTGDSIHTTGSYNQCAVVYGEDFEFGFINLENGELIDSKDWIRTSKKFTFTHKHIEENGFIGLHGNGYGHWELDKKHYNAYFYNEDDKLVKSIENVERDSKLIIPDEADYILFSFKQNNLPPAEKRLVEYRSHSQPEHISIRKCHCHNSRRCGMALGYCRNIIVEENKIHDIKGVAPECGIDIEDGNWVNQNYLIKNNNFYNNGLYDLVLFSGMYISVENNLFEGSRSTINNMVERVQWRNNKFKQARLLASGESIIDGNHFYGSSLEIFGDKQKLISNNQFHNSRLVLNSESPYTVDISNCQFYSDEEVELFYSLNYVSILGEPVSLSNCKFKGKFVNFVNYIMPSAKPGYIFKNIVFSDVPNVALMAGYYENCKFFNVEKAYYNQESDISIKNCVFEGNVDINTLGNVIFYDNQITVDDSSRYALKIENASIGQFDRNIICGQDLKYYQSSSLLIIEDSYKGESLSISNNFLKSNKSMKGIENNLKTESVHLSNNLMKNCH